MPGAASRAVIFAACCTTVSETLVWQPVEPSAPLTIPLAEIFGPSWAGISAPQSCTLR
jgi:hypothetical protein